MLDLTLFPTYFCNYQWNAKHALFGYPADSCPEFRWIAELERRAAWLRGHLAGGAKCSGLYLIKDIIQWGGSQNGRLQEFEDSLGKYCLESTVADVVANLTSPKTAMTATRGFLGLGLTYRSKVLRFLDPVRFGALDRRLRKELGAHKKNDTRLSGMPVINDTEPSIIGGYVWFCGFVDGLVRELEAAHISRPDCRLPPAPTCTRWRAADVEMALFQWALGSSAGNSPKITVSAPPDSDNV